MSITLKAAALALGVASLFGAGAANAACGAGGYPGGHDGARTRQRTQAGRPMVNLC